MVVARNSLEDDDDHEGSRSDDQSDEDDRGRAKLQKDKRQEEILRYHFYCTGWPICFGKEI